MSVEELIDQLKKANPSDQVIVGGKENFAVEIIDTDKLVSLIPLD